MKIIFLVLLLFTPIIKADQPRLSTEFSSSNGKYIFRLVSGFGSNEKWALLEQETEKALYHLDANFLSSMTVLVSDDGEHLISIDDWSERGSRFHWSKRGKSINDLDVLSFYHQGKLIRQYTLGELLKDTENIESSVSHFSWFFYPKKLQIEESKLSLNTFELVNFVFDIKTGEILERERDSILSDDALYVYGTVGDLGNRRYEIKVCHVVQGVIPKGGKVKFEVPQDAKFFNSSTDTVVIRNGKLVAEKEVIFNLCNYQKIRQSNRIKSN